MGRGLLSSSGAQAPERVGSVAVACGLQSAWAACGLSSCGSHAQ